MSCRSDRKSWSIDEDRFLLENYKTRPNKELAEILGRSEPAIRTRARELKVIKDNNFLEEWQKAFVQLACFDFKYEEIAVIIEKSIDQVKKYINKKLNIKRGRLPDFSVGAVKGPFEVVGYKGTRKSQRVWECKCLACGKIIEITSKQVYRYKKSCGCLKFTGHEKITGTFWSKIKRGARDRNGRELDFDISIEYANDLLEKQNSRCGYTDRYIFIDTRTDHGKYNNTMTASLDRIDSERGYVENNVHWVHKDVNIMKMDYDEAYFIRTCGEIWRHSWQKAYPGALEDCFGSHGYDWV